MAIAHFSFKFTSDILLPHDIDSFVEAEVFIPDVKCVKIRGRYPTTPELIHVEIEHDDGSTSEYDVE